MPLKISTFKNGVGGNILYKALSHPLAGETATSFIDGLKDAGPVAIFDPHDGLDTFCVLYPLDRLDIAGVYVQKVERLGQQIAGHTTRPITELGECDFHSLLIASFDDKKPLKDLEPILSKDVRRFNFSALRLPTELLTDPSNYLADINFATNFAFFRDEGSQHTRIATAAYWNRYGASHVKLWCRLFDGQGTPIATWQQDVNEGESSITIDSRDVRRRFDLPAFCGQLFIHVVGAQGHDVVKYAIDTFVDDQGALSATHDANSWPADMYGGLPAPSAGEKVFLWIQNSHARAIPGGEIGISTLGNPNIWRLDTPVGPYATKKLNVADALPQAQWPNQLIVHAGKHVVRPRYEVVGAEKRTRIAHVNVVRTDLSHDGNLLRYGNLLGKMHILPASVLPVNDYDTEVLPTPMTTAQITLPIRCLVYDADGKQVAEHDFGDLTHQNIGSLDVAPFSSGLARGYGHIELVYNPNARDGVDGWLHALFRYTHRLSRSQAETSFGSHIFNTLMTYKGEPQSYSGSAPGLTTRLYLRIGTPATRTLCHLIYPVSRPWRDRSATDLILRNTKGEEVARERIDIPGSGSRLWYVDDVFSKDVLRHAGENCYLIVRDETCRLFGYHGLVSTNGSFSFDHMFGF
ncbi:MAG: hypothetical protein WAW96_11095 [Alphaproteobacteria bacterium]